MEKLKADAPILSKVVYERKGKSYIKKGTDSFITTIIELILNFESFSNDCNKSQLQTVTKLQKIKWKLKTARGILLKHFNIVKIIIGSALIHMVEREICDVF
jgi:hypothetical protein